MVVVVMIMMRMKTEMKNDLLYIQETKHFGLSILFNYSCIFFLSLAKITDSTIFVSLNDYMKYVKCFEVPFWYESHHHTLKITQFNKVQTTRT